MPASMAYFTTLRRLSCRSLISWTAAQPQAAEECEQPTRRWDKCSHTLTGLARLRVCCVIVASVCVIELTLAKSGSMSSDTS